MDIARFRISDFEQQPLRKHIRKVAALAEYFGQKVHLVHTMMLAGLLHDMGKYAKEYQSFIHRQYQRAKEDLKQYLSNRERSEFDHGVYGARYAYERFPKDKGIQKITREILALVVAYHHGSLPDCEDENGKIPLLERMKKLDTEKLNEVAGKFSDEIPEDLDELFEKACKEMEALFRLLQGDADRNFMINLIVKMMYSMLIDADRLDAMCFETDEEPERYLHTVEELRTTWKDYRGRFENHIRELGCKSDENGDKKTEAEELEARVNAVRKEISEECLKAAEREADIFWLTVLTGGGKTLSSMRFALRHNQKWEKERIIYVLPFTTIITQNAEVVRRSFSYDCDLLEHHSNVVEDNKAEDYSLLTERWGNDIIFTTMVQFLNTFYGAGNQDVRRLHNLMNATIIFDEVQAIPVKCLYLFNSAVNFLREVGNSTIVFSSATQPNLDAVKAPVRLANGRDEIIQDVHGKFDALKRVEIKNCMKKGRYTAEEATKFILEKKESVKSLLVVVNKVKTAVQLCLALKKKTNAKVILLTSYFCSEHQEDILCIIRDALDVKEDIICVSTSIIEAGIDISFEAAIRNNTKLDSVIQTAGRVNRDGENEIGFCYVINLHEGNYDKMYEVAIGGVHTSEIFEWFQDVVSQEAIEQYFNDYFGEDEINKQFPYPLESGRKTIYEMLSAGNKRNVRDSNASNLDFPLWIRFSEAAKHFHVIEQGTFTVIVPYKEGAQVIKDLEKVNAFSCVAEKRSLLNKSRRYAVSLYEYQLKELMDKNAVKKVDNMGVWVLDSGYYEEEFGVKLKWLDEKEN